MYSGLSYACTSDVFAEEGQPDLLMCECPTPNNQAGRIPSVELVRDQMAASDSVICRPSKPWTKYEDGHADLIGECGRNSDYILPPYDEYLQFVDDGDLYLEESAVSHSGPYRCENGFPQNSHTINLHIYGKYNTIFQITIISIQTHCICLHFLSYFPT